MRWSIASGAASPRALRAFPSPCAVCRTWDVQPLCRDCRARFAPETARCAGCGLRTALPTPRCGACLAAPLPFDRVVCGCDYGFPWDRLITRFKFRGEADLAGPLAPLVAIAVERAGSQRPDLVVPAPLAPRRLAERGYNQAWELARRVARHFRLPADAHCLQRPIDGVHQAGLPLAQRRSNVRGSIIPNPARRDGLGGARVALVDDVMTSGATLAEAAAALRRAGAAQVEAWVLARTPAPGAA